MSTHPSQAHPDPFDNPNRVWNPPPTEAPLYASFWQGYEELDTCIVYDSDTQSGEAWVESTHVYRRDQCR